MTGYAETALIRGLQYLAETQAAIAHNLANVDTAGFKRRAPMALADSQSFASMLGQQLPVVRYGERTDFTLGNAHQTGNRFDVALGQDAWFRVQDDKGRVYLTRDGQMQLDSDGRLVTHGKLRYLDQAGNPLQLNTGDTQPNEVAIAPNGQVSDPTSGQTWGPIGIFKVPQPQLLQPQGAGLYTDPNNQKLELSATGAQQGYQEASNVDSLQELVQMILVQRSFSATQKALGGIGRMQDRLIENVNR